MAAEHQTPVVPSQVGAFLSGLSQALVPASVRVLDRLIGAALEIPVALLKQQAAKIDAKTESLNVVQHAIGVAAAAEASGDKEIVSRAVNGLLRKEYRRQANKEAVAAAMIENLRSDPVSGNAQSIPLGTSGPDDDWLNVFERYSEDASTPRMQELWGRVVAGEIRSPGRYSLRTLRYLSEFSQADGLRFEYFAKNAFCSFAPENLVNYITDKRLLLQLDSDGLVTAAEGNNLNHDKDFDSKGKILLREGNLAIVFCGIPNSKLSWSAFPLTTLGIELLGLIPGRDARVAARKVARVMRSADIYSAYLADIDADGHISGVENLWGEVL